MAQRTKRPHDLDLSTRQILIRVARNNPLEYRHAYIGPTLEAEPQAEFRVVQRLACLMSTPDLANNFKRLRRK